MGKGPEQEILKRRCTNPQQIYGKMLITNHQGNTNQNHNERPPHTCLNGYYQKEESKQVLVRMWIYEYIECLTYYRDVPYNITFVLQLKK